MRRAVILRIAPAALRAGLLAGEAESIATGERAPVRSPEDLIAFLRADERRAQTAPPPHHAPEDRP